MKASLRKLVKANKVNIIFYELTQKNIIFVTIRSLLSTLHDSHFTTFQIISSTHPYFGLSAALFMNDYSVITIKCILPTCPSHLRLSSGFELSDLNLVNVCIHYSLHFPRKPEFCLQNKREKNVLMISETVNTSTELVLHILKSVVDQLPNIHRVGK